MFHCWKRRGEGLLLCLLSVVGKVPLELFCHSAAHPKFLYNDDGGALPISHKMLVNYNSMHVDTPHQSLAWLKLCHVQLSFLFSVLLFIDGLVFWVTLTFFISQPSFPHLPTTRNLWADTLVTFYFHSD